jgi:hypothetical protein
MQIKVARIASSLPINKSCEKYIGSEPLEDRVFWRGDPFVVRYKGELVDVSIALAWHKRREDLGLVQWALVPPILDPGTCIF